MSMQLTLKQLNNKHVQEKPSIHQADAIVLLTLILIMQLIFKKVIKKQPTFAYSQSNIQKARVCNKQGR